MLATVPTGPILTSAGTGGFMHPEKIAGDFGVREGMSVADFGSGAGYFTILLGRLVGESGKGYALDIQETALDNVRVKARAVGLKNIEAIRTNLEVVGSSGLPDSSQDMVLVVNVLFQSDKKAEIIREAKRVLKDSGRLVLIGWKLGTGGFGPPEDRRADENAMRDLIAGEGLVFEKTIDAGQFHYGMIFVKS